MSERARHRTTAPLRLLAPMAAVAAGLAAVLFAGTALACGSGTEAVSLLTGARPDEPRDLAAGAIAEDTADPDKVGRTQEDDTTQGATRPPDAAALEPAQDQDSEPAPGRDEGGRDTEGRDDPGTSTDDGEEQPDQFPGREGAGPPDAGDYVDITTVEAGADGGGRGGVFPEAGSFTISCGTNADGAHRNSDNIVLGPGKRNAAQHTHDYVGNTATRFDTSDEDFLASGTTCTDGDQSTYYWPVLRDLNSTGDDVNADGGGLDGNAGSIMAPSSVDLTFHGNSGAEVAAAPQGIRFATGDAKAGTNGDANANAKWTCTGFTDRFTAQYPLCPEDSDLVRVMDFPSCWDGENTDSEDHRSHVSFTDADGACADGTTPIPALRMTLTYNRPDGRAFALDSFPDQRHDPVTDHASSVNFMPEGLMAGTVRCLNAGRTC